MQHGADPAVGQMLGGYRIQAVLGRGGMGVVYRAVQPRLHRDVALKVIAPELADDPAFRERFERESALAASIDHPHVLPVYEAGDVAGTLYLAVRYVDGNDLAELLRSTGPLQPGRAVRIVEQLASALDAAHAAGLVHRDVKPANVLVTGQAGAEHSYLTDFGLTKRSGSQTGITRTGQWMGTLDYVAPEQIKGDAVDARADVYALGCLLYELVTGRKPFARDNDVATIWAHISDPPPAATAVDPALPAGLDAVIARALAKHPAHRFATAGHLASAAVAALPGHQDGRAGVRHRPEVPEPAAPAPPDGTRTGAVAGLIAVGILLVQQMVRIQTDWQPLGPDPTGAELLAYYTDFRATELVSQSLFALAFGFVGAFLWVLPGLVARGRPVRRGAAWFVRAAGAGAVLTQFAAYALAVAPTFQLAPAGNPALVETLWVSSIRTTAAGTLLIAVTTAAVGLVAFGSRGLRSWLAWSSLVVAGVNGISAAAELNRVDNLRFLGTTVLLLWITATAIGFLVRESSDAEAPGVTRRHRLAAGSGLAVALSIIVIPLVPFPEITVAFGPESPPEDVELFYRQSGAYQMATTCINLAGVVLSVGYWWVLYRMLYPAARTWAVAGWATILVGVPLTALAAAIYLLPAAGVADAPTSTSMIGLSDFVDQLGNALAGVSAACFGIALLRARRLPRWLARSAVVIGGALITTSIAGVAVGQSFYPLRDLSLALFILWSAAGAIVLLVNPRELVRRT